MKRELTCIICPIGCSLTATWEGEEISVCGNTCPRGAAYAKAECTSPMRTVTATVRCGGEMLPVKTDRPIPKDKIFACMAQIHSIEAKAPVKIGDILCRNVFGANIVATRNI